MSWQSQGRKVAMGQFVRAKAERMVLIRFDGEPKTVKGKGFNGEEKDELQFPVTFWDERSVAEKYKDGEAASMVRSSKGEVKLFPVSSPPLLREILEEDEEESIMGRTFIIKHTGASKDTKYKLIEVRVPRQAPIVQDEEEDEEEEPEYEEEEPEEEEPEQHAGRHPRKEPIQPPTRKNRPKTVKPVEPRVEPEAQKEAFDEMEEPKPPKARKPRAKKATTNPVPSLEERDSIKPVFDSEGKEITDPAELKKHDDFMKKVAARKAKVQAQVEDDEECEESTDEMQDE